MPVTVVCVGKLRERFFADAAAEYLKRLRRLMPVTVIEVPDEPEPVQPGEVQNEMTLRREGERILARLSDRDHVIALCVDARQYARPELADRLDSLFTQGTSHIAFVHGGSPGLPPSRLRRDAERVSMNSMSFPLLLPRRMLLGHVSSAATARSVE